jgi:hypothetical protein
MKKLLLLGVVITQMSFAVVTRVMKYNDCASTNITTSAWVTCATTTRNVNGVGVLNGTSTDLIVCLTEASTSCDTTNQIGLDAGSGFVFDNFPASSNIFLKSQSGTCSTGVVSCQLWMEK